MPSIQIMYNKYNDQIHFITVNVRDNKQAGIQLVNDNNYTFPVLFDEGDEILQLYRVQPIPLNIFIDKNGEIKGKIIGTIGEADLELYLQNLIE